MVKIPQTGDWAVYFKPQKLWRHTAVLYSCSATIIALASYLLLIVIPAGSEPKIKIFAAVLVTSTVVAAIVGEATKWSYWKNQPPAVGYGTEAQRKEFNYKFIRRHRIYQAIILIVSLLGTIVWGFSDELTQLSSSNGTLT